jgi:hypothetical protein
MNEESVYYMLLGRTRGCKDEKNSSWHTGLIDAVTPQVISPARSCGDIQVCKIKESGKQKPSWGSY